MAAKRRTADAPAAEAAESVAALQEPGEAELFGISELCAELGITQRTVRFYEDKGLLAPRRINGTRVYSRRDRARLVLILRARAIGSSLAEIREYLDLYGPHGEGRRQQLEYVRDRTQRAIEDLERKRAQIDTTLAELRHINRTVRAQLGKP